MRREPETKSTQAAGTFRRHPGVGFTLVEILVTLGIILLLLTLLFAAFSSGRREAQMSSCASNLRQIYFACSQYAADNEGTLPPFPSQLRYQSSGGPLAGTAVEQSQALVASLTPYTRAANIWRCPSDNTSAAPQTVEYSDTGDSVLLIHTTSYDYQGWDLTDQGIKFLDIDGTGSHTRLEPAKRPLIEDDAHCASNDGRYRAYNHRGWWNRVYCDGHSKPFTWDCSDPVRPVERH